jgi:uncharacterized membrane protein (Fun14 family)
MAELDETRRRPVRVISLLLFLQAVGLAGVAAYGVLQVDWQQLRAGASSGQEIQAVRAVTVVLFFAPPTVLALLGALGCLFSFRWGWILAEFAQALSVGACLILYSDWNPSFVYPVMLYCIVMILYLNSQDVRVLFQSRSVARHSGVVRGG